MNMWAPEFVRAILLSTGLLAQENFETSGFDVAGALLKNGVDISIIPELANRSTEDTTCFCSVGSLQTQHISGCLHYV